MCSSDLKSLAAGHRTRVLLNSDLDLALRVGVDGIHLTSRQLSALRERPAIPLVGASCHDAEELRAAALLGADFAVLGPVLPTQSHPGARSLGWDRFDALTINAKLPVFALGGIARGHLATACSHGAHGIAMLRGAWA